MRMCGCWILRRWWRGSWGSAGRCGVGKLGGDFEHDGQARHLCAFRLSLAKQLLESGYDIRTVQGQLGHEDVSTAMIYPFVLNRGGRGVLSPSEALFAE